MILSNESFLTNLIKAPIVIASEIFVGWTKLVRIKCVTCLPFRKSFINGNVGVAAYVTKW